MQLSNVKRGRENEHRKKYMASALKIKKRSKKEQRDVKYNKCGEWRRRNIHSRASVEL